MTKNELKELADLHGDLMEEQAIIKLHTINVKELADKLELIILKEGKRMDVDPYEVTDF